MPELPCARPVLECSRLAQRYRVRGGHQLVFENLDFSITKNTQLKDQLTLQFRAEFFNILNHPNYAQPNHNIIPGFVDDGSPGSPQIDPNPGAYLNGDVNSTLLPMGLITQTPDVAQTNPGLGGGGPRVIQLGLKVLF